MLNRIHGALRTLPAIIVAILLGFAAMPIAATADDTPPPPAAIPAPLAGVHWQSMPIRSAAQAAAGMNGGEGAQCIEGMTRCASDDNRLYMDIDVVGVWRSDNGGAFWQPCLMKGLRLFGTTAIAVSPANHDMVLVYCTSTWDTARAAEDGVYRSTDGGDNWTRVVNVANNDTGNPYGLPDIAFANGKRVYFGAYDHGFYRSDDAGATWTGPLSLIGTTINKVAVDPSSPDKVWAATSAGLQLSTDGGNTFTVMASGGLNVHDVSVDAVTAKRVYYIAPHEGLQRSNDGGATWTAVSTNEPSFDKRVSRLYQSPIDSLHMILTTGSKSRVSSDGGVTWQAIDVDTSKTYNQPQGWNMEGGTCWSYTDPNSVVGANACLVYASMDGGKTWADSSTGFTGFHHGWGNGAVAFSSDPNRFAIFCYDTGMNLTTDNGSTWIQKRLAAKVDGWWGGYAGDMSPDWNTQPVVVEAAGNYFHADIMRSATGNTGASDWADVSATNSDHYFVRFNPKNSRIIYADNQRSDDGGKTFKPLSESIRGFAPSMPDTVYAYGGGMVKKSIDRGDNWTLLPSPPSWAAGREIAVDPVDPNKLWAITDKDISVFDGTAWTPVPISTWAAPEAHAFADRVAVDPTNPKRVIAGMNCYGEGYLFLSDDAGTTWSDITGDLPRLGGNQTLNIQPVTGRIFIGNGCGTYTALIGKGYPKGGDTKPPTNPLILATASKSADSVNLTWKAATDNVAVRSYDVYAGDRLWGSTTGTSYTVKGLAAGTAYIFTVHARDNAGNESVSGPLKMSTGKAAKPSAPPAATPQSKPDSTQETRHQGHGRGRRQR